MTINVKPYVAAALIAAVPAVAVIAHLTERATRPPRKFGSLFVIMDDDPDNPFQSLGDLVSVDPGFIPYVKRAGWKEFSIGVNYVPWNAKTGLET